MPTYDYRCATDGVFSINQRMVDHAKGVCPTCKTVCTQILTSPPGLDIEAMSRIGMPGAFETVGDRITKRHKDAGQFNSPLSRG